MAGSILNDTKRALGLAEDYTPFDDEITFHINGVLSDLNQMGIGPEAGYAIASPSDSWDELLGDEPRLNNVKLYLFTAVRMRFDPPQVGYVLTAMEKQLEKQEWRITNAADDIRNPVPTTTEESVT